MTRSGTLSASLALAAGIAALTTASASAETFSYVAPVPGNKTPSAQSLVPAGAQFANVDMYGAQGGGRGAHVTARLAVTPGQVLTVIVGGAPIGPNARLQRRR